MQRTIPDPSDLPALTQQDLNEIIEKHIFFERGQKGGARAVLTYLDLSNLSFKTANLTQADFTGSLLIRSNFENCNLSGCNFFASDLSNANLRHTNCKGADFRGSYVAGADFTGADLSRADLREGKIMRRSDDGSLEDRERTNGEGATTIFIGARLEGANMSGIQASNADLRDANMRGVILGKADLSNANLSGANMTDADLTGSNLSNVKLKGAILTGSATRMIDQDFLREAGAILDDFSGDTLERMNKTLPELLDAHKKWVSSAGKKGKPLDLSGFDLRDVIDLNRYSLTAIKAVDTNFMSQNLSNANMQSSIFDGSDFRDCIIGESDLRGSSFKHANFVRANLDGATLCPLEFKKNAPGETLRRTNLSGADLRYASLVGTDLRDSILMGVDLSNAILTDCDLRRADLTGANLDGAVMTGALLDDALVDVNAL